MVTVVVSHLSLEEDSRAMQNPDINKLFVEYRFLGLPPEDTETPFALPKPRPYHSIAFNFSKSESPLSPDCCVFSSFTDHDKVAESVFKDQCDKRGSFLFGHFF